MSAASYTRGEVAKVCASFCARQLQDQPHGTEDSPLKFAMNVSVMRRPCVGKNEVVKRMKPQHTKCFFFFNSYIVLRITNPVRRQIMVLASGTDWIESQTQTGTHTQIQSLSSTIPMRHTTTYAANTIYKIVFECTPPLTTTRDQQVKRLFPDGSWDDTRTLPDVVHFGGETWRQVRRLENSFYRSSHKTQDIPNCRAAQHQKQNSNHKNMFFRVLCFLHSVFKSCKVGPWTLHVLLPPSNIEKLNVNVRIMGFKTCWTRITHLTKNKWQGHSGSREEQQS